GDGHLDLALAAKTTDKLMTLHGTGADDANGNCVFVVKQDSIVGGNGPETLVAGNFDGVSGTDLIGIDRLTPFTGTLVLNDGAGNFTTCSGSTCSTCPSGSACKQFSAGSSPSYGVATDYNADGNIDLAIIVSDNGDGSLAGVNQLMGIGGGVFTAGSPFGTGGRAPEAAAGAQFGGDASQDLVVVNKG